MTTVGLRRPFPVTPGSALTCDSQVPLHARSATHGGLTPIAPVASVRPPAQLRLLRCTNAYTPRVAGVSPPWLGDHACRGNRESQAGANSHSAKSGGCEPAVAIGNRACNGDFRTQSRQHVAQRGAAHVGPPWRSGIALAKALPQSLGRLSPGVLAAVVAVAFV